MGNANDRTIQAYQDHVEEYINDDTPQSVEGGVKEWLDLAVASLSTDARIFEFGSGPGRDAAYLQGLGFRVECSDAAPAFVEMLKNKGLAARKLNAITDDLGGPYDLVLANAVLLHFTPDELDKVLGKVFAALKPGGRFAFSVKQGQGEEWTDYKISSPRYLHYYTEQDLRIYLKQAGLIASNAEHVKTKRSTWIHVIATKPQS